MPAPAPAVRESLPSRASRWIGEQLVRHGLATIPPGPTKHIIEREDGVSTTPRLREDLDSPAGADFGYRRLSQSPRDMDPLTQERAQKTAEYLWSSNPLVKRALQVLRDLIIADGFTPHSTAQDPAHKEIVQDVLDKFWNDPDNAWDTRLPERILELLIYGEQPWRVFTRPWDGRVKLGLILPENIGCVHVDPDNAEILTHIELKQPVQVTTTIRLEDGTAQKHTEQRTWFEIVRVDERRSSKTFKQLRGEVFFWTINRMSGGTRGVPEVACIADWADMLDQFVYAETQRSSLAKLVWADVTLEGLDDDGITEWKQRPENMRPPKPGSVRAHNESEKWELRCPNLNLKDSIDFAKFLQNLVLGGIGIPEAYFCEGGNTNKATAAEQSTPVFANVRAKQKQFKDMFEMLLLYVVQQARASGNLLLADIPPEELGVVLQARDPEQKRSDNAAEQLDKLGSALANAIHVNFLTEAQGARIFKAAAIELGYQIEEDDSNTALMDDPSVKRPSAAILAQVGKSGGGGAGAGGGSARESWAAAPDDLEMLRRFRAQGRRRKKASA